MQTWFDYCERTVQAVNSAQKNNPYFGGAFMFQLAGWYSIRARACAYGQGGVTALSPAARRGMEGYVRPYAPDCCRAHDCGHTRYPHHAVRVRALHA